MGRLGNPTPALPGEEGTTRVCRRCHEEKPIEQYSWYRIGEQSRQSQCKSCANEVGRQNYKKNTERYKSTAAKRKSELRRLIDDAKSGPCMDCGNTYPPSVMDFDHVRGTKVTEVSAMYRRNFAWPKIKEEIEKCDLVCATCHRMRTLQRRIQ